MCVYWVHTKHYIYHRRSIILYPHILISTVDHILSNLNETGSRKAVLNHRSMSLKTYKMPKYCTVDFKTLETYHNCKPLIFLPRKTLEIWHSESSLQGMCTSLCLIGQRVALLDDAALCYFFPPPDPFVLGVQLQRNPAKKT